MMKRMLIALDYDPTAQQIAETGYDFAKAMGAEVILIHVVSDPIYYATRSYSPIMGFDGYLDTNPVDKESLGSLIDASHEYLSQTRRHLGDERIGIRVEKGDFAETILKVAEEEKADMITIGSHSQKWLEKIVMGSVTEQVLKHSKLPLLIIPTGKKG